MKTLLFLGITLFLAASASSQPLTVHEWGTFTTVHGSNGTTLSGLYYEEERLPDFVYHLPGFSPDPYVYTKGYKPCKGVTVKMETPVLYFYSPTERSVNVKVQFPMGSISQWYPDRTNGEMASGADTLDFTQPRTGSIEWDATILAPASTKNYTHPSVTKKWEDPRNTDANLVSCFGEVEKYLFYRGVANFSLPVEVSFNPKGELVVKNGSALDIPFIYIYDHQTVPSGVKIWGIGPLAAGETKSFTNPEEIYYNEQAGAEYAKFRSALQAAGLTYKEAESMLNTWSDGYFQTLGFKIFWIVPRQMTDQILPIQITPVPDSLERVLVGKTEILPPDLEARLLADFKAGSFETNWQHHHYYLAYRERVVQLAQAGVAEPSTALTAYPNPVDKYLLIEGAASPVTKVTLRNLLGETMNANVVAHAGGLLQLDVSALSSGPYFVTLYSENGPKTLKMIKR